MRNKIWLESFRTVAAAVVVWAAAFGAVADEMPGRRKFAAACPPVTAEMARKPGPPRVMMIFAHPDDADIRCGCLTVSLIQRGFKVKFVSIGDGRLGHHRLSPEETASVRRTETLEVARRFGLDGYDIYGHFDIQPTYELRCKVARAIREYEPDYVITHRTCDYHSDHRGTGVIVMDVGYWLGIPHWLPDTKPLRRRPIVLFMSDEFNVPLTLKPDVMIDAEPFLDRWCDALDAQVSQFYQWLPWDKGIEGEVKALGDRSDIKARNAYLCKYWAKRKKDDAARFAGAWTAQYPGRKVPAYMEVYEVSEYGRAPTDEDLRLLTGDKEVK